VAAISILANQPITPYMLAQAQTAGSVTILDPDEEFTAETPNYRAVSLIVPPERAVGGYIATDDRVDVIATFPMEVALGTDPETGETIEAESQFTAGSSTKLMWLDVKIITRPEETSDVYIVRADLQTAEEIAHAQNQGAQFTMALRPEVDTRDVDRSDYGETTDTLLTRYNFRIPQVIEAADYPQPQYFPSPFPNTEYLEDQVLPSPTPDGAIVEIPIDETVGSSPLPEESPAP
jgi:Flp pilus assembly protein CpaB